MGYPVFIKCDQEDCEAQREVQQIGELPQGWSYMEFIKHAISLPTNGRRMPQGMQEGAMVRVRKVFCSWRCHMKEVKKYLVEKVDA